MTHVLLFQPWRLVPLAITLIGISLLQPLQGQTGAGTGVEQSPGSETRARDYRVGPQDLLEYSVLEAPEIRGSRRVSAGGEITLPLAGAVKVAGKTPQEVETALEDALRKSFMKDPHVSVLVHEMESHPVSVAGAVKKPGVFKIAGPKTVLEMISLTEGLAEDAGDTVIVMHGAGFPAEGPADAGNKPDQGSIHPKSNDLMTTSTVAIKLKELLNSTSSQSNVLVYPGDIVKVTRAELVYVLGAVKKPGGFILRNNENITILQAIALAEGPLPSSARSRVRIMRTTESQNRQEIAVDIDRITNGKAPDSMLQPNDIVVIPPSGSKTALYRSLELIVSTVPAAAIYRGF